MTAAVRDARPNEATRKAQEDTVLRPRFYTTDFAAMDRMDISSVRPEWDALIEEFRRDTNRGHFQRPTDDGRRFLAAAATACTRSSATS